MAKIEKDEISGTDTTGHEWDGIKELNTPLPRWWIWTFYATIVWSIGYCIAFPAIPLLNDATKGLLGYSSRAEVVKEIDKAKAGQSVYLQQIKDKDLEAIRSDSDLYAFARAGGRSAFVVNCVQCHGSGAAGFKGYPNLNDDEWLWGGKLQDIYLTIAHGIRYDEDEDTRVSAMPAFGKDGVLTEKQIADVTEYVLSFTSKNINTSAAQVGKEIYVENCAACHKEDGSGDREQGAPSLKDAIWLYGGDKDTIIKTITYSRNGVMPAWKHRLDEATLKKLAVYVHSLGGGE